MRRDDEYREALKGARGFGRCDKKKEYGYYDDDDRSVDKRRSMGLKYIGLGRK